MEDLVGKAVYKLRTNDDFGTASPASVNITFLNTKLTNNFLPIGSTVILNKSSAEKTVSINYIYIYI